MYSVSADKKPGKGTNETIEPENEGKFNELSKIKNWRRSLAKISEQDESKIKEDPTNIDILKKTQQAKLMKFNPGKPATPFTNLMKIRSSLI